MGDGTRAALLQRHGCALAALVLLTACSPASAPTQIASAPAPVSTNVLAPASLPAFFDCLGAEGGGTLVAAHRGGPEAGYAENAIATFQHTIDQIPAALEIDVRETSDGTLVLMHDEDVDRTTNGTGNVASLTAAQFAALRLKDGAGTLLDGHPPTLREALDWAAGKTILELDVKQEVSFADVAREVEAANASERVIIITYSVAAAIAAHRAMPNLMISVPIESEADLARLERAGFNLNQVLAWTGTEEPNSALNVTLAQHGVESIFGTLGKWDQQFAHAGDYGAFADTGVEVIATDLPLSAYRGLDQWDGEGSAPLRCATQ